MSDSAHQHAARALASAMMRHPEASVTLADTHDRLLRGSVPVDYWRIFHQSDRRAGTWPIEQVACYLSMHAALMSGQFVRLDIELLEAPAADAERASNHAVISTLPRPFFGQVDQHQNASNWGDGGIWWDEPVIARRSTNIPQTDDDGSTGAVMADCTLAALRGPGYQIPLEVGSTMASVTYTHLVRSKAVARWPYGSTKLTILADANRFVRGQADLFAR